MRATRFMLTCLILASSLCAQVGFNPGNGPIATGDTVTVTNTSGQPGVAQWHDANGNPVGDPVAVPSGGAGTGVTAPPVAGTYTLKVTVLSPGTGGSVTYKVN